MKITMLTDCNNYLDIIEESKKEWIDKILSALGIDLDELYSLDASEQVQALLEIYKIEIITYPRLSAVKIYYDDEPVGEWAGPEFLLKRESGDKYYEITVETWAFTDEEISMS
jgi:hypothetical protein